MLLDQDIVNYIRDSLGIKATHVTESVLAGRADEYSAIYHLLVSQREREDVPKITRQLKENWEVFRACSRQDNDDDDKDQDGPNEVKTDVNRTSAETRTFEIRSAGTVFQEEDQNGKMEDEDIEEQSSVAEEV